MAKYVSSRQDLTNVMIEEVFNDGLQVEKFQDLWQLRVRLQKTEGRYQGLTQIECALIFSYPVYRHPSDESPPLSPFTPTIALIREHVQKVNLDPLL